MAAPPSQTFRQISFLLSGAAGGDVDFSFGIRPEELTVQEPSRLAVQQTMGGAWADSFDVGVSTITLAGHNGWKGGALLSGEDMFQALRATVFTAWHQGRADALASGQDPDTVKLYFTDSLDEISVIVAPKAFTLRRSKTSPLLIRYQIQLLVLGPSDAPGSIIDEIINGLSNPLRWLAAKLGLTKLVAQINRYVQLGRAVFGAAAGAIQTFVNIGVQLISSIAEISAQLQGVFDPISGSLLNIGTTYSRAASTAFSVLAVDSSLTDSERLPVQQMAAAFNDAACSMANGFDQVDTFPSYAAMRGASTCSSTGGGDPSSVFTDVDANPFASLYPSTAPLVSVSDDARQALITLQDDPLQLMLTPLPVIQDLMRRAGIGVSVAV